jgi:alpha-beta hydrolase superfamily lysophospholipase
MKRIALVLAVAVLGFIVGCAAVFIVLARRGPPLELWHSVELETEYVLGTASEVDSFPEYQALERRLFAELDERVYAHTATGPSQVLARYSTGSLADPHRSPTNWNASFELPASPARGGVLLLHGMSDGPYSLRALGEALNARGFHVVGLRLPGHGTAPSGLETATWEDMAGAVRLAARHLAEVAPGAPLHLAGYSTGAPLAIHYTLTVMDEQRGRVPESLVLISPAIAISPAAAGASWLRALSKLPGLGQLSWTQILPEFDPFKYNSFAVNAGVQVHRLTRTLARDIESRAANGPITPFPRTLIFLSTVDATVSADAVIDNLLDHLAAGSHELVLFDINRSEVKSTLLVSEPGPLTDRLMGDGELPFHLTLLQNSSPESAEVVVASKPPFSERARVEAPGLRWPTGVISLSHVALPFSPDDPLYGARPMDSMDELRLGQIAIRGERGLLRLPADWLLRLRYNPIYDYLEERSLHWIDTPHEGPAGRSGR